MIVGGDVKRSSACELEVDVVAADILNRLEVSGGCCMLFIFTVATFSVDFCECVIKKHCKLLLVVLLLLLFFIKHLNTFYKT